MPLQVPSISHEEWGSVKSEGLLSGAETRVLEMLERGDEDGLRFQLFSLAGSPRFEVYGTD